MGFARFDLTLGGVWNVSGLPLCCYARCITWTLVWRFCVKTLGGWRPETVEQRIQGNFQNQCPLDTEHLDVYLLLCNDCGRCVVKYMVCINFESSTEYTSLRLEFNWRTMLHTVQVNCNTNVHLSNNTKLKRVQMHPVIDTAHAPCEPSAVLAVRVASRGGSAKALLLASAVLLWPKSAWSCAAVVEAKKSIVKLPTLKQEQN